MVQLDNSINIRVQTSQKVILGTVSYKTITISLDLSIGELQAVSHVVYAMLWRTIIFHL